MQTGMIGLGRMGAGMVRRLLDGGHDCVVYNRSAGPAEALAQHGAIAARSLADLAARLVPPRVVWLMLPAAAVDGVIEALLPDLSAGDVIVDGANSHPADDRRRASALAARGFGYLDVGVSGGVWGLTHGYCLMIGGEAALVQQLGSLFVTLAPPLQAAPTTPGRDAQLPGAERGWLHCGPSGAGHFVKMVHNGIEYGLMAAYAEGFNILRHAGVGTQPRDADAEAAPLADPAAYRYDFDLAGIAELWRRGSVVRSWLLDLTAHALLQDPELSALEGRVADSGEGRWALQAAIDEGVPAPVLASALFARFGSRGLDDFANRVLSAMRREFGGHPEPAP